MHNKQDNIRTNETEQKKATNKNKKTNERTNENNSSMELILFGLKFQSVYTLVTQLSNI